MNKNALVLSGGGARGAYQIGVLKALAASVDPGTQPFPIITGVSVGALNGSVLASHPDDFAAGVAKLEEIWRNLHCDQVFAAEGAAIRSQLFDWAKAMTFGWAGAEPPHSILDNSPLQDLIAAHVDFDGINKRVGNSALEAFAITASSYQSGRALTFFLGSHEIAPWDRARRVGIRTELRAEHIMGSSALPLIFPAVKVDGRYLGDGALREQAPLAAAIHLGADRIVTIGARDLSPDAELSAGPDYPSVGFLAGQMLDILFNDNTDADIERAHRINRTLALLPEDKRAETGLRPVDVIAISPSQDIRPIAGTHVDSLPGSVRFLLGTLGGLKEPWVLPSYLMFEPGYIGELIDLGERDGLATFEQHPILLDSRKG